MDVFVKLILVTLCFTYYFAAPAGALRCYICNNSTECMNPKNSTNLKPVDCSNLDPTSSYKCAVYKYKEENKIGVMRSCVPENGTFCETLNSLPTTTDCDYCYEDDCNSSLMLKGGWFLLLLLLIFRFSF